MIKYFAGSFFWGVVAKVLDAGLKFLTIPLLLSYFGKANYGLLTLALATNAYMQLMNLGMNTGAVKYFSEWISLKRYDVIDRVSRTNLTFYLTIGVLNALVLIVIAFFGGSIFKLTRGEFDIFRYLLFDLALFSVLNWTSFVFNQLLIANEMMGFTQKMLSIRSILNIILVPLTIYLKLPITQYFFWSLLLSSVIIFPQYYICKKNGLIKSFIPAFYWKEFSKILKYSLAIFALGLFQFMATQSRPLILGMFTNEGVGVLAEYRIVEVFPIFIISLGGMIIPILLPKTSKAILNNDRAEIEKMAYQGTKYTSILVCLLCLPIILNSKDLLTLYVGESYSHLYIWLSLWVITITLYLHNTPSASLLLSTGKTKILVGSTALASILSMIINAVLAKHMGVGSAVWGYLVYIAIQMFFYYLYINNKVLGLSSLKIFRAFIFPTLIGFVLMLFVSYIDLDINRMLLVVLKSFIWVLLYVAFLFLFRQIEYKNLRLLLKKG